MRKRIVLLISFPLFALSFVTMNFPMPSSAAEKEAVKITVVSGIVQNVSGNDIVVNDHRYATIGVPLFKPSGQPATGDDLKNAKMAEIYLRGEKIIKVVVFTSLPVL